MEDPSAQGIRPELEFIFRTLVDLRMDVDDLRKEFETYRSPHPGSPGSVDTYPVNEGRVEIGVRPAAGVSDEPWEVEEPPEVAPGDGAVVYRSGMTMEDLERAAIAAVLVEVRGNRRKAAQMLAIGERTLYRKIKAFQIDEEEAEST